MKCKKCSYISFDYLSACAKCGKDLTDVREELGLPDVEPAIPFTVDIQVGDRAEEGVQPSVEEPAGVEVPSSRLNLEKGSPPEEASSEDLMNFIEEEVSVDLSTGRLEEFLKEPGAEPAVEQGEMGNELETGPGLEAGELEMPSEPAAEVPAESREEVPAAVLEESPEESSPDTMEFINEDMSGFMDEIRPSEQVQAEDLEDSDEDSETDISDLGLPDLSEDLSDLLGEIGESESAEPQNGLQLDSQEPAVKPASDKKPASKSPYEGLELGSTSELEMDISSLLQDIGIDEESSEAAPVQSAPPAQEPPALDEFSETPEQREEELPTLELDTDLANLFEGDESSEEGGEEAFDLEVDSEISLEKEELEPEPSQEQSRDGEILELDTDFSDFFKEESLGEESASSRELSPEPGSAAWEKSSELPSTRSDDVETLELDTDFPGSSAEESRELMQAEELELGLEGTSEEDSYDLFDFESDEDVDTIELDTMRAEGSSSGGDEKPPEPVQAAAVTEAVEEPEPAPSRPTDEEIEVSEEQSRQMMAQFEEDLSSFIADMEMDESTETRLVESSELELEDEKGEGQSGSQEEDVDIDLDTLLKELDKSS